MRKSASGCTETLANIFTDLRPEPKIPASGRPLGISLICPPTEARDRLRRVEDLGFDDALLVCPEDDPEQLETIRNLVHDLSATRGGGYRSSSTATGVPSCKSFRAG
jgi:hypothetical protein